MKNPAWFVIAGFVGGLLTGMLIPQPEHNARDDTMAEVQATCQDIGHLDLDTLQIICSVEE